MRAVYEKRKYDDLPVMVTEGVDFDFPPHWHADLEILFIKEGETRFRINDTMYELGEGDIAVCGSGDVHQYTNFSKHNCKYVSLIFKPDFIDLPGGWPDQGYNNRNHIQKLELEKHDLYQRMTFLFNSLIIEFTEKPIDYRVMIKSRLLELTATLNRCYGNPIPVQGRKRKRDQSLESLREIITYIEDNYMNEIDLETIARRFNVSSFHFSRMFKQIFDKNFKKYLNEYRVYRADVLLQEMDLSILQIALECGFRSVRTFNRVYKEQKGYPPSQAGKAR